MQRPTSVTVFGILHIVFGVVGIFGALLAAMSLTMIRPTVPAPRGRPPVWESPLSHPVVSLWTKANIPIGLVTNLVLMAAGVGLLSLRPWARLVSIYYAMLSIVLVIVGVGIGAAFVTIPLLREFDRTSPQAVAQGIGAIGGVVGSALGLIYPALLWYFMTRPHVIAAFQGRWDPLLAEESATLASPFAEPIVEVPYSGNPYSAPPTGMTAATRTANGAASVVSTLVPSKNPSALVSYYLGLVSLFPLAGAIIGVFAVYYGIQGLRRYRQDPAVRGKTHAWVGVICGALFGLGNWLLVALMVVGMVIAFTV